MIDIGEFVLGSETLVTVVGVAIFTAMAVSNFIKPAIEASGMAKDDRRYSLYVNGLALVVALLFSFTGLLIAKLAFASASTLAMAGARAFAAAFFATGGYEVYSNITMFIARKDPS